MSHYSVAIICESINDVDDLLEPFSENLKVEPYIDMTYQELMNEYNEIAEAINTGQSLKYNAEYLQSHAEDYKDFQTFLETYYTDRDFDKEGNLLTTYNPNSKWDYYNIGGRWNGDLLLKNGKTASYAKIKDIEFDLGSNDSEKIKQLTEQWENLTTKGGALHNPQYFIERYGNLDNFIKQSTQFSTYALLDAEGNWYEPGQMGWFGISNSEPTDEFEFNKRYMELINSFDSNYYLVIVDCHI